MRRTVLGVAAVVVSFAAGGSALVASVDFGRVDAGQSAAASDAEAPEAAAVELAAVQVGEISTFINATANLVAQTQIDVVAETPGRIAKVHVEEGEVVSEGALLVSLDDRSARLATRTARIKAANVAALQARGAALAEKDLIAMEELQKLTTDRDVAVQDLADARLSLSQRRVRAPRKGKVTRRDVTAGQYVREGDTLFELTDFDCLEARIFVPERDALEVEVGREVELVLQARDHVVFTGVVHHVSSKVDPESGTVEVTIRVDAPPTVVRSGSFVDVKLVRTRNAAATWLPREAVIQGPRGAHVFVVEDGIAHRREVTVASEERGRLAIAEGLDAGEQVVLSGHDGLQDGDRVEPTPA